MIDDLKFVRSMSDSQLLHLAKNSPGLLTKSQLLKVMQIVHRPKAVLQMRSGQSDSSEKRSDMSETQSADVSETRSDVSETRSDVSELQSVDGSTIEKSTRHDDGVIPWGDRDADDEMCWSDGPDGRARSESDVGRRSTSDDAEPERSDIGSDDVLARYYIPARFDASDGSECDSATGNHDVMSVTGQCCLSMLPAKLRQRSTRGGASMGFAKVRAQRVRGSSSSCSRSVKFAGIKAARSR